MINNRFIIKGKLGEGRSKVFLCSDVDNPGNNYALKVLPAEANTDEIEIFRSEFFTQKNLNHPNIVSAYDEGVIVKTDNENEITLGSRFIVIEYFPGIEFLNYNHKDENDLLNNLKQICSALYYLHQSNYIYYDLKPENILVGNLSGKSFIKLIDLGFAQYVSEKSKETKRGTAEYIAPEILKDELHDHRADLYSLGIILYQILYKKFPFQSDSALEIYKEQVEKDFEFPESDYSPLLIEITKKLLEKDPSNRYFSSLEILNDLNTALASVETKREENLSNYFIPADIFIGRADILSSVENYFPDKKGKDAVIISGAEGSGKTSLFYKIYSEFRNVILINQSNKTGISFVKYFLKKIIYSEFIYPVLATDLLREAENIISVLPSESTDFTFNLKSVLTRISASSDFTIIIDDFNLLDHFTADVFKEIIPVMQVNGINIILGENSEYGSLAGKILNKTKTLNLLPFDEENLSEYIDKAFAPFFPKNHLKDLLLKYSDLLPGSIISFIKDLVFLNIISFTNYPEIIVSEKNVEILESSHEEIFRLRVSRLTVDELNVARILSSFQILPDINFISAFIDCPQEKTLEFIHSLEEKNILRLNEAVNIQFTSENLKRYIYSTIDNKKKYHKNLADFISEKFNSFNKNETARQYELAEDFLSSYKILNEEIKEADKLLSYSYKKSLIEHLLSLSLPDKYKSELNYNLALTLFKLNDSKSALNIIEDLLSDPNVKVKDELIITKGICLINSGKVEEGKNLLLELAGKISDKKKKEKIMVEIAYSQFDLGDYESAESISKDLINNEETLDENKGKCFNLLGLLDFYKNNNFEGALNNFQSAIEKYKLAKLLLNEVKMEVNIGNSYFMNGDYENAKKHWTKSIERNQHIGSIDQEARTLAGFGVLHYSFGDFDKAIEQYQRALDIFTSLGNRNDEGIVLTNLGEIFLTKCDYEKAIDYLRQSMNIFIIQQNDEEEAEVLFMLGKLFLITGDYIQLNVVLENFQILIKKNLLPVRHINNFAFLESVHSLISNHKPVDLSSLKEIIEKFKEQNEGPFLSEGYSLLCEALIKCNEYEIAQSLLNDEKYEKITSLNFLYLAEKKYLLGLIQIQRNLESSGIQLIEEAFDIIKDSDVTELHWKVLFLLGEIYLKRGNMNKASEYLFYSKEVIQFLASSIKDNNLHITYLKKPERQSVFSKVEFVESEFKIKR